MFTLIKDTHIVDRIVLQGSFTDSKYVYCLRVFHAISAHGLISANCMLSIRKQREQLVNLLLKVYGMWMQYDN